jgi:imidazole glycerol phosphate synthase glutamine amidotransferase subunit
MTGVTVVDTGVANLASLDAAFRRLGVAVRVTDQPETVRGADRLVLPGVGDFAAAATRLAAAGLDGAVREAVGRGVPLLAVCLGFQLLCEGSEEAPGVPGLGLIEGACCRLPSTVRVPHLGWNRVEPDPGASMVASGDAAFANSYALPAAPRGWIAAWSTHGARFVAALEAGNILACQFHPELSGTFGAGVLTRWLGMPSPASRSGPARSAGVLPRLVSCLDVRDGRVVKGVRFQDLRDAGDPATCAARYEEQGADEVVVLDVAASPRGRDTQVETVRQVRAALGIPLVVGGGVRSIGDAGRLLAAGADRVSVNTAAVKNPMLLDLLAGTFGRQCVVLAVDARRATGGWEALVLGGRATGRPDAVGWMAEAEARGAGEILLTSWDRDGTGQGPDEPLLRAARGALRVPVVASGGIATPAHVAAALAAGADAVLVASALHDRRQTVATFKDGLAQQGMAVRR